MNDSAAVSLFLFFAVTTLMIIGAYYTTRWIGNKTSLISKTRHISLLEKTILPGGVNIQAIKVGSKVYIVAGQGKEMVTLDKYSIEEWEVSKQTGDMTIDKSNPVGFPQIIHRLITRTNPDVRQEGPQEGDYD
ncbi:hypothetical protein [Anoxynatronum buryatiense]|uniref:Uncharacterized protein n=1 Tax=Anoxynatronum buryatiense TaxID=489973 RepID=A0AA46AI82_9CLOT|nr:hypothetical protein [Anoxynatronum buryatiense]SMP47332.1 hypothetical protein SAMN06296020_103129 [Anoxynatronum buryatiense]